MGGGCRTPVSFAEEDWRDLKWPMMLRAAKARKVKIYIKRGRGPISAIPAKEDFQMQNSDPGKQDCCPGNHVAFCALEYISKL